MRCETTKSARYDGAERDRLVLMHMPLVFHVARRMHARLGGEAELGDLVSAGTVGLIAAVDGFEVERGLAFSTYAAPRVRGAMLDELRRLDPATRSVRRRSRQIGAARDRLSASLGRAPRRAETAAALNVDVDTLWRWESAASAAVPTSLEARPRGPREAASSPVDLLVGADGRALEARLEHAEDITAVKNALAALPERERTVLTLYYYEELKLREIADLLGLTESRISQIRTRALKLLRELLDA